VVGRGSIVVDFGEFGSPSFDFNWFPAAPTAVIDGLVKVGFGVAFFRNRVISDPVDSLLNCTDSALFTTFKCSVHRCPDLIGVFEASHAFTISHEISAVFVETTIMLNFDKFRYSCVWVCNSGCNSFSMVIFYSLRLFWVPNFEWTQAYAGRDSTAKISIIAAITFLARIFKNTNNTATFILSSTFLDALKAVFKRKGTIFEISHYLIFGIFLDPVISEDCL
jgi:hypothetical protein